MSTRKIVSALSVAGIGFGVLGIVVAILSHMPGLVAVNLLGISWNGLLLKKSRELD